MLQMLVRKKRLALFRLNLSIFTFFNWNFETSFHFRWLVCRHVNYFNLLRDFCEMIRKKKIHRLFKKPDIQYYSINQQKVVQFLDTEFNLTIGTISPFMKSISVVRYINESSNNSSNIIKQIPLRVHCRWSQISSTEDIFKEK